MPAPQFVMGFPGFGGAETVCTALAIDRHKCTVNYGPRKTNFRSFFPASGRLLRSASAGTAEEVQVEAWGVAEVVLDT